LALLTTQSRGSRGAQPFINNKLLRTRYRSSKGPFVAPLLFLVFWFWILVAGLKSIVRAFGRVGRWLSTPWGDNADLFPTLRGSVGQEWSADEYRQYSTLAAQTPVPAIPDVMQNMERALQQEKRTAEQLGRDIADWTNAIEQLNRAAEDWTQKAATALGAGRNDLARAAIAERQKTQERIKDLEKEIAEMRRLLTSHSSDIQSLESKLSTTYRRNHLAETRLSAAETSARAREMLYGEHVRDALSRFDVLERAADEAEGRADSLALGSGPGPDQARIDAELAALPALPPAAGGFGRKRAAS
jgi:phage shock protein A